MATLSSSWWKVEPESPGFATSDHEADFWGLDDDVTLVSKEVKDEPVESKSAAQLLDELDEWIKEEPFAVWLEEKIDLPFLDNIPEPLLEPRNFSPLLGGSIGAVKPLAPLTTLETKIPQPQSPPFLVPGDTRCLLEEFESVFEDVENNFTLTPPQSPTHPTQPIQATLPAQSAQFSGVLSQYPNGTPVFITTLQQMIPMQTVPDTTYQFASSSPVTSVSSVLTPIPTSYSGKKDSLIQSLEQIVPSPAPDLDEELAAVDELIRTRVEDLETSVEIPQTPPNHPQDIEIDANSSSSFQENFEETLEVTPPSPSTTSNSSFESSEDDPDWVPTPVHSLSGGCEKVTGGRKRAPKPYARVGTEDKKLRKKEQNKNAATRYRQKKKAEVEEILGEEKQLADTNEELQSKVNDLAREIKYLKGLMRDVFKAKGLLK